MQYLTLNNFIILKSKISYTSMYQLCLRNMPVKSLNSTTTTIKRLNSYRVLVVYREDLKKISGGAG